MSATRIKKPEFVKISEEDWNALTENQQLDTTANFQALLPRPKWKAPVSTIIPAGTQTVPQSKPFVQQETEESSTSESDIGELVGIRRWNEPVGSFSADRIRNCIIYQLDVKRDPWWAARMTKGFIKAKAEKLDADTPEDYVWEKNPLFSAKRERSGDVEFLIWNIEREPKNEAERKRIREKFGVTSQTIPYLAKKSCLKCHGTGSYSISSYPGDPVYGVLTESVECDCSFE